MYADFTDSEYETIDLGKNLGAACSENFILGNQANIENEIFPGSEHFYDEVASLDYSTPDKNWIVEEINTRQSNNSEEKQSGNN